MTATLTLARVFLLIVSMLVGTALVGNTVVIPGVINWTLPFLGAVIGCVFGSGVLILDVLLSRFNLRSFNTVLLGLAIGYLMGSALTSILSATVAQMPIEQTSAGWQLFHAGIMLTAIFLGVTFTVRSAEELYASIPFVRLKPSTPKKKDIFADTSILADARLIDLASSGLLDHRLVVPRFVLKDLFSQSEGNEEPARTRARRALEVVKKLESIPNLELRYTDTDFGDLKDPMEKLIRLARLQDAQVLTADMNRIQMSSVEGVIIINIHALSNALKPLMQTGEQIAIKIQRPGKEPRQGVGYLEDGTMVVVNGGGDYIGELIKAQVLSVKHTSSGRMIFCNAAEEESELRPRTFSPSATFAEGMTAHVEE